MTSTKKVYRNSTTYTLKESSSNNFINSSHQDVSFQKCSGPKQEQEQEQEQEKEKEKEKEDSNSILEYLPDLPKGFTQTPCITFGQEILICGGKDNRYCYSYHIFKKKYKYICKYPRNIPLDGHTVIPYKEDNNDDAITLLSFGGQDKGEKKYTLIMKYRSIWESKNEDKNYNKWKKFSYTIGDLNDDMTNIRAVISGNNLFAITKPNNIYCINLKDLSIIHQDILPIDVRIIGGSCFILTGINRFIMFNYKYGFNIIYNEQEKKFKYKSLPVGGKLKYSWDYSYIFLKDKLLLFGGHPDVSGLKSSKEIWVFHIEKKRWNKFFYELPNHIEQSFAILDCRKKWIHLIGGRDQVSKIPCLKKHIRIQIDQLVKIQKINLMNWYNPDIITSQNIKFALESSQEEFIDKLQDKNNNHHDINYDIKELYTFLRGLSHIYITNNNNININSLSLLPSEEIIPKRAIRNLPSSSSKILSSITKKSKEEEEKKKKKETTFIKWFNTWTRKDQQTLLSRAHQKNSRNFEDFIQSKCDIEDIDIDIDIDEDINMDKFRHYLIEIYEQIAKQRYKRSLEKNNQETLQRIRIKNPLIIMVGIGRYDNEQWNNIDNIKTKDIPRMKDLFENVLKYKFICNDPDETMTTHGLLHYLTSVKAEHKLNLPDITSTYGGIVLILSGYGDSKNLITSDGKYNAIDDIYKQFNNKHLRSFEDKPKIVITQIYPINLKSNDKLSMNISNEKHHETSRVDSTPQQYRGNRSQILTERNSFQEYISIHFRPRTQEIDYLPTVLDSITNLYANHSLQHIFEILKENCSDCDVNMADIFPQIFLEAN